MHIYLILISLFYTVSIFAQGFIAGHKSGLLGGATNRENAIEGVATFPSTYAFNNQASTELYSSLTYLRMDFKNDNDSTYESESQFIPNFGASGTKYNSKIRFVTFLHYTGELKVSQTSNSQDTSSRSDNSIEALVAELGASISYSLSKNQSLGLSVVGVHSDQSVNGRIIQDQDTPNYLTAYNTRKRNLTAYIVGSYSFKMQSDFFSVSLITPSAHLDSKGNTQISNLVDSNSFNNEDFSFKPEIRSPGKIGFGWQHNFERLKTYLDLFYYHSYGYKEVYGNAEPDFYEFKPSWSANFGLEYSFQVNSLLLGVAYQAKEEEKNNNFDGSDTISFSVGAELKQFESRPVVGIVHRKENTGDNPINYLFLVYSTRYNL